MSAARIPLMLRGTGSTYIISLNGRITYQTVVVACHACASIAQGQETKARVFLIVICRKLLNNITFSYKVSQHIMKLSLNPQVSFFFFY